MKRQNFFSILFTLLLTVFLVACNQDVQTQVSSASHSEKPLLSASKPRAAVSMEYEINNPVAVNTNFNIHLRFKVGRNVDALQVNYHIESGMQLSGAKPAMMYEGLSKGEEQAVVLNFVAEQSGKHILHVYATIRVNGTEQSRAFIVPVSIAADASQPVQQKVQSKPSDKGMRYLPKQNVISMPASESVN